MEQPPDDPLLGLLELAVLLASAATWLAIVARWRAGRPVLEYQPRPPVPWGAPVAMLAILFVAIALFSPAPDPEQANPPEGLHPIETAQRLVGFIFIQCAVVGGALFIVTVLYRAGARDFGFPVYAEELALDVRTGLLACVAALAPVYGVQLLMLYLFGPSHHPLVEMVTGGEPSLGVILLATVAAVIVAPISEEIFFRLLLQGWLEKWEDRHLGWRETVTDAAGNAEAAGLVDDTGKMKDERNPLDDLTFAMRSSSLPENPPARGLGGLPYGTLPILISSLLFALAHFGYGPDPIAIFFLALILGYVYQRTHRIVPCMVAHALFNSLAMLILWRAVFLNLE